MKIYSITISAEQLKNITPVEGTNGLYEEHEIIVLPHGATIVKFYKNQHGVEIIYSIEDKP